MKFAHPDWRIICKKTFLGGHGKSRRTVKLLLYTREIFSTLVD